MKKSPDSREASYGRAQAGKGFEHVNVVEKCKAEPFGASGVPFPGPCENFFEVC